MKILFLDAVQDFGGSQKSTINLISNLEGNHEVLYVDFWGTDIQLISELTRNNIRYKVLDKRPCPILINDGRGKFFLLMNAFRFFKNFFLLKTNLNLIINDFEPNFIVVNNLKSLSIIRKKGFKVILFERTWFINTKITKFNKYFFEKVDYFFAVSHATKFAIYAKGIANLDRIHVLQNSLNMKYPYKALLKRREEIRILNCGGYIESKGLHYTLQVANELKKRDVSFHIDIVGVVYKGNQSLNYYKQLQNYILNNNLRGFVTLHRDIKDMSVFYEQSDILIHPTYSEGLPRVIMEAMSFSIPVISNSVGGVNDYILDNFTGFLADFNNIEKYVDRILLLRDNPEIYNFITRNAYNLIRNSYSDEIQKKNLNNIFKSLVV